MEEKSKSIEFNGSAEKKYSYVVHGAKIACTCGSRTTRLIVPVGHGNDIHDMPILTVYDYLPGINIRSLGYCSSLENPQRQKNIDDTMRIVRNDRNFFDKVMSFFEVCKEPEEYAQDISDNIVVVCKPEFAAGTNWTEGTEELLINGKMALNSKCSISCKWGGSIIIVEDGQENAIEEQKNAVKDFASWNSENQPALTNRNQQELEKYIKNLEEEINNCKNPKQKIKLLTEFNDKQKLNETMKTALYKIKYYDKMLEENPYCENIEETLQELEVNGSLDSVIENGSVTTTDSNGNSVKLETANDVREYYKKQLEENNRNYTSLEQNKNATKYFYENSLEPKIILSEPVPVKAVNGSAITVTKDPKEGE